MSFSADVIICVHLAYDAAATPVNLRVIDVAAAAAVAVIHRHTEAYVPSGNLLSLIIDIIVLSISPLHIRRTIIVYRCVREETSSPDTGQHTHIIRVQIYIIIVFILNT